MSLASKRRPNGFSLIELLVVVAILALLAGILFPVFARAKENARDTANLSNVRQLASAILMYGGDHADTLPLHTRQESDANQSSAFGSTPQAPLGRTAPPGTIPWQESVRPYVGSREVFLSPKAAPLDVKGSPRNFALASYYGVVPRAASPRWQGDVVDENATFSLLGGVTGNRNVEIDGPMGSSSISRLPVEDRVVNDVPSLASSQLPAPSHLVLVAEAAAWEMGFAVPRSPSAIGPDSPLCFDPGAPSPFREKVYMGPLATRASSGRYDGGRVCAYEKSQRGMATIAAADGSALRIDLRKLYEPEAGTNRSSWMNVKANARP